MFDKPKRKNDEPIPRRYWWLFGILALMLLTGLWFPIRLWTWYELNFALYALIAVSCLLATVRFIRRFHWRHGIVLLTVICLVLAVLSIVMQYDIPVYEATCTATHTGIFSHYHCSASYTSGWAYYMGLRDIPIVIAVDFGWVTCWW